MYCTLKDLQWLKNGTCSALFLFASLARLFVFFNCLTKPLFVNNAWLWLWYNLRMRELGIVLNI